MTSTSHETDASIPRRSLLGTAVAAGAGCLALPLATVAPATAAPTTASASAAVSHLPLFGDHFSRTRLGRAWTAYNRAARVAGGRLVVDGDYLPGAIPRDGWVLTHVGDASWRDYSISVSTDSSNAGGNPGEAHAVTLYARVKLATPPAGRQTCYRLDIWDPGQPDPSLILPILEYGAVGLSKYVRGVSSTLAEVHRSATVTGSNCVCWRIVAGLHTVTINGVRVLSFLDTAPIGFGGVGVGQIWETNGSFDDVIVRAA